MTLLVLGAEPGVVLEVLPLGATVHRLLVTDAAGVRRSVALGHRTAAERLTSGGYIGATVGRYANRIARGRFPLGDGEVVVPPNDRGNALHGGPAGFDKAEWSVVSEAPDRVELELVSPDGDQGFPGTLTVRAVYTVEGDVAAVTYTATTDATTVVNLTNHAYFNLVGDGTIDEHLLTVDADAFTPVDADSIPLGGHLPVDGTPFDLRTPKRLGPVVRAEHEQLARAQGVDHNYVVNGTGLRRHAALAVDGLAMELWSDQPGVQVYTGNFLDGTTRGHTGAAYRQGDGIALEPQLFPDSVNHPEWPSAVLEPGATYSSRIEWRFSR
jgi:galactose mutarotase-like enzyme